MSIKDGVVYVFYLFLAIYGVIKIPNFRSFPWWGKTLAMCGAFLCAFAAGVLYRHTDKWSALVLRAPKDAMIGVFACYLLWGIWALVWGLRHLSELKRLVMLGIGVVSVIAGYALLFVISGGVCADSDCKILDREWVTTLYFSAITFTTTGYGDYHPQPRDRLLAASEALAGYVIFGLFVSLLSSYFSTRGRSASSDET